MRILDKNIFINNSAIVIFFLTISDTENLVIRGGTARWNFDGGSTIMESENSRVSSKT